MEIRPIRTEDDYQAALREIDRLFNVEPGTPDADRLDVLATLTEAYEEQHHAIESPDPISALEYYIESRGLTRKDLATLLGSRARVSEILNRKRGLTSAMIRRLHQSLSIPTDLLIQPYELV